VNSNSEVKGKTFDMISIEISILAWNLWLYKMSGMFFFLFSEFFTHCNTIVGQEG